MEACPPGFYGVDISNECDSCDPACSLCYGPSINECEACVDGYFLLEEYDTCIDVCIDGYYGNSSNNKCSVCSSGCATCTNISANCTSCNLVNGFRVYLSGVSCVQDCDDGYYEDRTAKECLPCVEGCATCDGPTINHCQSCKDSDDGTKMFFKVIGEDTCMEEACPVGQFIKTGVDYKCQACSSSCVGCAGSATNCSLDQGCPAGSVYNNATNSCLVNCTDGFYKNTVDRYCTPCPTGCELCYGGTTDKCTKCAADPNDAANLFFLRPFANECTQDCEDGYWERTNDLKCAPCQEACLTCETSASDCSSCGNVTGIVYYHLNTTCYFKCPTGYYGDTMNNLCVRCGLACSACYDGQNSTCTSCLPGFYLQFGTD